MKLYLKEFYSPWIIGTKSQLASTFNKLFGFGTQYSEVFDIIILDTFCYPGSSILKYAAYTDKPINGKIKFIVDHDAEVIYHTDHENQKATLPAIYFKDNYLILFYFD